MKFRSALATLSAVLLVAYSASSTLAEKQAATEVGHAPLGSAAALAVSCSGCHGEGGRAIVSLEGLSAQDIEVHALDVAQQHCWWLFDASHGARVY